MIEKEGKGVVVYLNQEGRGIGLMEEDESLQTSGRRYGYGGCQSLSGSSGG